MTVTPEQAKNPTGCFRCPFKSICKINDDMNKIHIDYNILGIALAKSAEEWCIYLQTYQLISQIDLAIVKRQLVASYKKFADLRRDLLISKYLTKDEITDEINFFTNLLEERKKRCDNGEH